jgi:hypothetical protein
MNTLRISFGLICLFIFTGCHTDSDYLIGDYSVTTNIKLSSCPEKNFVLPTDAILPTALIPEQTGTFRWIIRRIGITSTGADQVTLELSQPTHPDDTLLLTGSVAKGVLRVEGQSNFFSGSCEVYRYVFLSALLEQDTITGNIRTRLASIQNTADCPVIIPPEDPCEVQEEFTGIPSKSF